MPLSSAGSARRYAGCPRENGNVVVFGGKTALEISRSLLASRIVAIPVSLDPLPVHAPDRAATEEALRVLAESLPALRVTLPVAVMVGSRSRCRSTPFRTPHVSTYSYKGKQFVRLMGGPFALRPNAALCKQACCIKHQADLLLLLWEACGMYQTRLTGFQSEKRVQQLTTVRSLARFCKNNPHLSGSGRVASALRYVRDGSASMRETQLALLLGLPRKYGGFGLGLPRMNHRVEATVEARMIGGRSHFLCDLCWPEHRIDVEYQSDEEHAGELMRVKDSRRANALASMGWTVMGVTNSEIRSIVSVEVLAETLRRLMRKRARPVEEDLPRRRLVLHRALRIVDDGYRYGL